MKWPCPIHNTGQGCPELLSNLGHGWMVGTTTKRRVCSAQFFGRIRKRKDLVKFGLICLYLEVFGKLVIFSKTSPVQGVPL